MTQAVILAGGKGTRLAERLNGRPKPLVDVNGTPLLELQVRTLAHHGIDDIVVLVNHAADQIQAFFEQRQFPSRVRLFDDGEPRGTAGALLACLDDLDDRFIVVYGDTLFDIDIGHMLAAHEASGADATLLLHPNDHPADSDLVEIDATGRVQAFHGYPHPDGAELRNLVNAAFYIVEKKALLAWRDFPVPCDFAKDLFPAMVRADAYIAGYVSFEYIKDLGTPKRLDKVEKHLRSGVVQRASRQHLQKAVFLDRDGTLNVLRDYVRRPEDFELLPHAAQAVRAFNNAEYRVVVVTNQPVIARGEANCNDLQRIHNRLESRLGDAGAYVDAIYFCPHHPDAGFAGEVPALKIACDCRKPQPGMMREAMTAMNIQAADSWMIGDSTADMLAARRAGLRSVLVETGEAGRDGKFTAAPDFQFAHIGAAAHFIVRTYPLLAAAVNEWMLKIQPGDMVLVGGLARSGKSTIASVLKSELMARKLDAHVLSLDRWLRPAGERSAGVLGRYALEEAQEDLKDWLDGGAINADLPSYDRMLRDRGLPERTVLAQDMVLILEGVPALLADWRSERRIWRLHVEAAEAPRRVRVETDLVARRVADAQGAAQVYKQRQQDETPPVAAARATADGVLDFDSIFSIDDTP
ncbi:HAD-IIIA family hydrolase [Variovorax beijingensis]|uniref:D,D-heptose 1,7-bisphosphate phosphatase n=1 Tax=Variovorax beijingensis TaxID=2496117 RepID=A0A3P3EKV6_9BURK|nr:HAD-IIIA family hydrolase [Variovorax beijingensis]RRH87015.1 HAD-IIIA family hydrolase [Variovorax beijingensis]